MKADTTADETSKNETADRVVSKKRQYFQDKPVTHQYFFAEASRVIEAPTLKDAEKILAGDQKAARARAKQEASDGK